MKALRHDRPGSAEIIQFYKPTGTSAPQIPPPQPEPAPGKRNFWQRHGTTAQWGALVIALLALGHNYLSGREATDKENQKLVVSGLIDEKLKPVNEELKEDFKELSGQLKELSGQVSFIQGELNGLNAKVKQSAVEQKRLSLLVQATDPAYALGSIRANLEKAQLRNRKLPEAELVDYRKKLQSLSTSSTDYWTTVADLINYQSFFNQLENRAPDPATVAHPCQFLTEGRGSFNVIGGAILFQNRLVDLETTTNVVQGAIIRDSVVHYHGGQVTINATFINCRFILDIRKSQPPTHPELLQQLFASDQRQVRLSTAG